MPRTCHVAKCFQNAATSTTEYENKVSPCNFGFHFDASFKPSGSLTSSECKIHLPCRKRNTEIT